MEEHTEKQEEEETRTPGCARAARESDFTAVAALEDEIFALHKNARPDIFRAGFHLEKEEFCALLADAGTRVLAVPCEEGGLAAFCVLKFLRHVNGRFNRFTSLYIDEFCVGPRFRRRGVGRALMREIRRLGLALGAADIELNVWLFNEDALAFYRAEGFSAQQQRLELPLSCADGRPESR